MTHPSPIRIAVCADTHFWPGAEQRFGLTRGQLQPWSEQIQESLLAELRAAAADLVFHLGDLTCGGGSFGMPIKLFYTTLDETVAAFAALPGGFAILPGNHDCPAGGDWSDAEKRFGLGPGLGQTIDLPTARLVLLNAQGHAQEQINAALPGDPTYGWVNAAELARLSDALATAGDRPVLLFVHQLIRSWIGEQEWWPFFGTENAADVLAVLAQHSNVRAVFQAHAHRLDVQQAAIGNGACWFVVGPAIIEYPLAWLQLALWPGQLRVTMQRLPLPDLAQTSLDGSGEAWRAGRPEWQNFTIKL